MTRQEAIDCLTDKVECRYCKANSENCRQDAELLGARSLEAWDKVLKSIKGIKEAERQVYKGGSWGVSNRCEAVIEDQLRETEAMDKTMTESEVSHENVI